MKKYSILFAVILSLSFIACNNSNDNKLSTDLVNNPNSADSKRSDEAPMITFETKVHNFGEIIEGEVVSYNFKFKNTGSADLIISSVKASCGCTVPRYPERPIKPGEEAKLEVTFNSSKRVGFQSKSITVMTNSQPSKEVLKIKAKVNKP